MTSVPITRRSVLGGLIASAVSGTSVTARADVSELRIDEAISRAMTWLASEQQPSGAWLSESFGESTATTSLGVMAMLAAGHIPDVGPFGRHLTHAVSWVMDQQQDNGLLVGRHRSHGPMYSHGIATLMLAEVAGMVNGIQADRCRNALEKAVRLIIDAQNHKQSGQHDGGWRYQPTSNDSDLSVTAWQLLALRAAKDIGCDVPTANIDRAIAYIRRLRVRREGGFGYMNGHGTTVTRSGTGIVALEVCGEHRTEEVMAAANLILSRPLTTQEHYFYYGVYYCTVGMYKVGGDEWKQVREKLYETILEQQHPNGHWTPLNGSEQSGGRVYATSLCVLALAIEYGYLPIYQR